MLGDVNNDSSLDTFDLLFMRKIFTDAEIDGYTLSAGDVNGDGQLDAADAVMLRDFLLGRIKSFIS